LGGHKKPYVPRLRMRRRADFVTVKELLGHEKLETTAIYTKPRVEDMLAMVERLNRKKEAPPRSGRHRRPFAGRLIPLFEGTLLNSCLFLLEPIHALRTSD